MQGHSCGTGLRPRHKAGTLQALDLALVAVSLYPPLTYFLALERIMPAYWAYRTLIEIVLEALPQVCAAVARAVWTARAYCLLLA